MTSGDDPDAGLPASERPAARQVFTAPPQAGQPAGERDGDEQAADAVGSDGSDGAASGAGGRAAHGSGLRRFAARRKPLVAVVAAVALLAALAATADLALAHTARQRIIRAASCRLEPSGPVSASLSGGLAGLRLLTGQVGTVHIKADGVRRDGMDLSVAAELHQVTTKGRTSGGTATATIPYGELGKRLGHGTAGLKPSSDGHGGLLLTGTLAGLPLPVTVHTKITTGTGTLTVTPTDVSLLGQDIPVSRLSTRQGGSALAARLAPRTVKAPDLPAGVTLSRAAAGGGGLDLSLELPAGISSGSAQGCAA